MDFNNESLLAMEQWAHDPVDMRAHVWDAVMYEKVAEVVNRCAVPMTMNSQVFVWSV